MGKRKWVEIEEKYDPIFLLPQDILEIIFGYLSVKELLNLSLVSSNWYHMIGTSQCMKRVKLVYNYGYKKSNELQSLLKSNRLYQHVTVKFPRNIDIRFTIEKEVNVILKQFASSIKSIETPIDFHRVCDLPKLKKITFDTYESLMIRKYIKMYSNGLFSRLPFIQELHVFHHYRDEKLKQYFKETLPYMINLKALYVSEDIFDETEYKFSLRALGCCTTIHNLDTFTLFLKSQSASLEILHLRFTNYCANYLLPTILTMPKLSTLSCFSMFSLQIDVPLPTNKTIKILKLFRSIFGLLASLKNLEVLAINQLNNKVLDSISFLPSMRKIKYNVFYDDASNSSTTTLSISIKNRFPNIQFSRKYSFPCYDDFCNSIA